MDDADFKVRFWGTRGSVPVSGPEFSRYGGNTACVEMQCGTHTLIFDAGSGIRPAGLHLMESGVRDFDLFLTHCHYDHIIGLPFLAPLYRPGIRLAIWSGHLHGLMTTEEMLREFMRPPWFPVEMSICRASLPTRDFAPGDVLSPRPGVTIRTGNLNHPGGCVGYRVEFGGRVVALISDTEHRVDAPDRVVLSLIEDADLVIYDCTYTEAEIQFKRGFGHSTWQEGARLCRAAGARSLALFHHDPMRTDGLLAAMEADAQADFPTAFASFDGQVLDIARKRKARRATGVA
jgi:phosphoribosyl 1,2-cyclic phosphodiesterase